VACGGNDFFGGCGSGGGGIAPPNVPFEPPVVGGDPLAPPGEPVGDAPVIGYLLDFTSYLLNGLIAAINWLIQAIEYVGDFLLALAQTVLSHLRDVFAWLRDHVIKPLLDDYRALKAWLTKVLGPIIQFIQKWYAWYQKYILKWQLRIQELIARLRTIVQLFRLLGFKWAAQLDADLRKIQSYVTDSIVDVVKTVNGILNVLNAVIDPSLILRKDFFAATLFSNLGAVKRAVGYGGNRPTDPSEQKQIDNAHGEVFGSGALATGAPGKPLTYTPAVAMTDASLDAQIASYGWPSQP
jgi:hypothetical protein